MEHYGAYSAMRWFQQFVQSTHPAMVALRRTLSVTFVPFANPGRYADNVRPRPNLNAVDLNRNWNYNWAGYTSTDADTAKGSAPMSEPEVQAIAALVAADTFAIDCHNYGSGDSGMQMIRSPEGKQSVGTIAAARWFTVYADPVSFIIDDEGTYNLPYLASWVGGQTGLPSFVLEGLDSALGSITVTGGRTYASREAVQLYAGFITQLAQAVVAYT